MNLTRTVTRANTVKRLFIQFCVFLVVLGCVFPLGPSQTNAAAFEINDVDTYVIAASGNAIYQLDGNNPGALNPKASLPLDSSLRIVNGLAISSTEDVFYAYSGNGGIRRLYRILPTGVATEVATLQGPAGSAVISKDNKYYYFYDVSGVTYLANYDLSTKQHSSKVISNMATGNGGDLLFDENGYIWFLGFTDQLSAYQVDPEKATVLRHVPMTSLDGSTITPGSRALSFLPNGKMYIGAGNTNTTVFELDPDTLSYRFLSSTNIELTSDAASRVMPNFDPSPPVIESSKTATLQEKAAGNTDAVNPEVGDTLLYTIQTRNTVDNSLIRDLTISDILPEGLEYVPDTLTVDGQAVSDDQDGDQGHYADLKVTGTFGDVTDTEWHTITFQATVKSGQAGKTIENTAVITGDNLDRPDEPKNSIGVYPLDPSNPPGVCAVPVALINGSFEQPPARMPGDTGSPGSEHAWQYFLEDEVPGWKTTASDKFIQIMKSEFIYNGMEINPPNGNQYAELNAEQVSALYQDVETAPGQTIYWRLAHRGLLGVDTMAVQIGSADIPIEELPVIEEISTGNTEWVYYSGSYTVPAGQTKTRFAFNSIDAAGGNQRFGNLLDDIFLGTVPCVTAEKSVSPGGDVFVGDELTYEISLKNGGGDIASNTVIEDAIPEGTEYVPGSMKIVNGPNLTDAEDHDAGHFANGKVTFHVGDLPNTNDLPDGITVQFKVKALSSHVGKTAANKAQVKYKNLLKDENEEISSNEVTNNVIERPDINACAAPVALINGSFEEPVINNGTWWALIPQDNVPGWKTTHTTGTIEIWNSDSPITNAAEGNQLAEINTGMFYQDVETTPGQTIYWRLAHKGREGVDTMQVRIGPATNNINDTKVIQQMSDGTDKWGYYSGIYDVPAGQTVTRFGFESIATASGNLGDGNLLDDIFLGTGPCVVGEKTVSPEGEIYAGQELTYEVTIKNHGGDIAANAVFEDAIPEGTEYVPGTLRITNGPGNGDLTDEDDGDAGHFDGKNVIVRLGNLPNTNDLPDGITVQFKVKALLNDSFNEIVNKAQISYDNLLTDDREVTESNETTSALTYQKPVLE